MELENLTEIFNNKIFRVPDYQRGYSWGKHQLEDLWRDLEILQHDKDHYTGMLSVRFDEEKNIYYVIDGQQRITTLIILIKAICDNLESDWIEIVDREKSDYIRTFLYKKSGSQGELKKQIFGYDSDNPSHKFFRTEILGLDSTENTPENTLYTINLANAKDFFEEKIGGWDQKQLEALLKKITKNLKFNFYTVADDLSEFVTFESMNNRGKPLSTLELLKNRLIYLSTLLPDNDDKEKKQLRRDINNTWKTIYEYLGKNPKRHLDDDFLQTHCIIYFEYDKEDAKGGYKDFLLKNWFAPTYIFDDDEDEKLTYEYIRDYVYDIQEVVKHYYFIHNTQDIECPYTDKEKLIISRIHSLGFFSMKPLVVALCCYDEYKDYRYDLFCRIEKCIFIMFRINFWRSDTWKGEFYRLANDVCECNYNECDDDEIEKVVKKIKDETDVEYELESFVSKQMKNKRIFYDWSALHYFLYEYEIHLQTQLKKDTTKVEWEHVNSETIEHIYPQTPDGTSWENTFEDDVLLHDLGNLLLLAKGDNSSLKNKPFADKKEAFSTDSYSAIEVSKSKDWTPNEVLQRRDKMLKFMDERFDMDMSDELIKSLNEYYEFEKVDGVYKKIEDKS